MATNGNDIIVVKNGAPIAAVRTHRVQTNAEKIETASPSQGQWREFIPGRKQWSVSVGYLLLETAANNVSDVLGVGDIVTLAIRDRNNAYCVSGTAICTECDQEYSRGNLASGSFSFAGTGPLTEASRLFASDGDVLTDNSGNALTAAGGTYTLSQTGPEVQAALNKIAAIEYATEEDIENYFSR